jgi:hypothetical protein
VIDRAALLADLQQLVRDLEDDLRNRCTDVPDIDAVGRAQWLRAESAGRTAQSYETWREGWITQAAVAWVLACVFVRFCEDNGLVDDPLLSGAGDRRAIAQDHRQLHLRQHHADSDREWLLAVFDRYRHLPGLGEILGTHNPLWELAPTADGARLVVEFWWKINPETGALVHDFTDASWDTRFLGDLYQDLSAAARDLYALFQTPDFVEEFILDRTLDPAIDEFGLAQATMIDPTCGSGHFLLGGFTRFLERWIERSPGENLRVLAQRALDAVHGVDVNPFAVAIARFRVLLAALQASRVDRLVGAPDFTIHVATGDSLLHGVQSGQLVGTDTHHLAVDHSYATEDLEQSRAILSDRYSAVVGNPPYIAARDAALNRAYRRLYSACHGKYSLAVPFAQRFFDLAVPSGFVGMITANSFMKREFGSKLIEGFLPSVDLTHVIDPSGLPIAGHGTGSVILYGRHRSPVSGLVRGVLRVRDEPGHPDDPRKSSVWQSIVTLIDRPGESNEFVDVVDLDRAALSKHPWSIGGGGAAPLKDRLDAKAHRRVGDIAASIGITSFTLEDDAFFVSADGARRLGLTHVREVVGGDSVRDWMELTSELTIFPYDDDLAPLGERLAEPELRHMWPRRRHLQTNKMFGGKTKVEAGLHWTEFGRLTADKLRTPLATAFGTISTHNHFALDRGGRVFKQSAGVVKLPREDDSEANHIAMLEVLNSSCGSFWLRQVMYPKSGDGVGRGIQDEEWETRYYFDSTKLLQFPLPDGESGKFGSELVRLAEQLRAVSPAVALSEVQPTPAVLGDLREQYEALRTRMVATQEELDWAVYRRFGLSDVGTYSEESPPVQLGTRAFEIVLAREQAKGELTTSWFGRHGSSPATDPPPEWPTAYRSLVEKRMAAIASDAVIGLLERPEFKRRWLAESWDVQVQRALRGWLLDRLESDRYWAEPRITTCARLAEAARVDADFMQVAILYAGQDFDLARLIVDLVTEDAVPYLAAYRYKEPGVRKRAEWERTWELQRAEDEIDARTALSADDPRFLTADQADVLKRQEIGTIPVPPKYASSDFVKTTYWRHRGKLDVPKERFISYPGAERENDPTLVVGWAGWDHLQRAQALSAWFTEARDSGTDRARLVPMLAGLWELVPWLRQWHNEIDPTFGERLGDFFASFTTEQAGALGHTTDELAAWRPPAPTRGRRARA